MTNSSQQTLLIQKNGREILRTPLPESQALIGRSPACDVVLRAPKITAIHFLLEKQEIEEAGGNPEPLWLLFDISSEKIKSPQRQDQVDSAQGVVLGTQTAEIAGFQFTIIQDALSSTPLAKGAFIRNLKESSEKQTENLKFQASSLNAIECLLYERQSGSVVSLRHLSLSNRNKILRPFNSTPAVTIKMPKADSEPAQLQVTKNFAGQILNRGTILERAFDAQTWPFLKKDFVEVQTEKFDIYLRYVHFEKTEIPRDPRLKWQAGALLTSLAIFAVISLSFFHQLLPEKPKERARVVTLQTEPRIEVVRATPTPRPTPPPPAPAPAPPAPKPVAVQPPPPAPAPPAPPAPVIEPKPQKIPKKATPVIAAKKSAPAPKAAAAPKSDWKSTLSQLKKQTANKRDTVKAESFMGESGNNVGTISHVSSNGPRRIEDSDDSLKSVTERTGPDYSSISTSKNKAESLAQVDVGKINANIDFVSSSSDSTISGGLRKEEVQETINHSRTQIRACYQKGLVIKPKLQGRILYSWIIQSNGNVSNVEIKSFTLQSKDVRTCIQQIIRTMKFPVAQNQASTQVLYPFYLAPY